LTWKKKKKRSRYEDWGKASGGKKGIVLPPNREKGNFCFRVPGEKKGDPACSLFEKKSRRPRPFSPGKVVGKKKGKQ